MKRYYVIAFLSTSFLIAQDDSQTVHEIDETTIVTSAELKDEKASQEDAFGVEDFFGEVADEPEPEADAPVGKVQAKIMQFLSYFALAYDNVASTINSYVKK